jgi:hypothetical protein
MAELDISEIADGILASAPNPFAPLAPWYERKQLSLGDKGTEETIAEMQKLVGAEKQNQLLLDTVGAILWGRIPNIPACNSKDYACYAKALYTFCRDNIKYVYDPYQVEYLEAPHRILEKGIGDCDSVTPLLVSMWESIGLKAQFVTIKADATRPDEFSHVYCRVEIPNVGWVVGDPTMPNKDFGWEPQGAFFKRYWHGSSQELDSLLDTSDSVNLSQPKATVAQMSGLGAFVQRQAFPGTPPFAGLQINTLQGLRCYNIPKNYPLALSGLGTTDSSLSDLQSRYSSVSDDFFGNVYNQPITSTSALTSEAQDIVKSLQRFASSWIPAVQAGSQSLATASQVLDEISVKVADLRNRIAAVQSGSTPAPALTQPQVALAIGVTPSMYAAQAAAGQPVPTVNVPGYSPSTPAQSMSPLPQYQYQQPKASGLSTGAKVGIAAGAAGLAGLFIYLIAKRRNA